MLRVCIMIIALTGTLTISAQSKAATKMLDRLAKKYDTYSSMEMDFDLSIQYPDRPVQAQKAKIIQAGERFVFRSEDQDIYGDGVDIWLHLKARNEVQINNYDEDTELGLITPRDLLKQYKSDEFKYDLLQEDDSAAYIEFVPTDRASEYSKYRLKINKSANDIAQVEAFGKDGSKYVVTIADKKVNGEYADAFFTFDADSHPGVYIEDLRID